MGGSDAGSISNLCGRVECARSVGLALRGVHIELNVLAFWDMREEDGTFRDVDNGQVALDGAAGVVAAVRTLPLK